MDIILYVSVTGLTLVLSLVHYADNYRSFCCTYFLSLYVIMLLTGLLQLKYDQGIDCRVPILG